MLDFKKNFHFDAGNWKNESQASWKTLIMLTHNCAFVYIKQSDTWELL